MQTRQGTWLPKGDVQRTRPKRGVLCTDDFSLKLPSFNWKSVKLR